MIGSKVVTLLLLLTYSNQDGDAKAKFAVFKDSDLFFLYGTKYIKESYRKRFEVEEIDVLFSRDYDENSVTAGVFAVEFVPYYGADLEVNFAGDPVALAHILQQREQDGSKILGVTTHYYHN